MFVPTPADRRPRARLIDGRPFRKSTDFTFFPGLNIETERQLYYERHRAVLAYARANRLDRIDRGSRATALGLVTAGKCHADLRQALLDLGLDDAALGRLGVRLLRVALIYPLDAELIREFARDLDEVVVIEEKRGFLEAQVKEALCRASAAPIRVLGKSRRDRRPALPDPGRDGFRRGRRAAGPSASRASPRITRPDGTVPGRLDAISRRSARGRTRRSPGRTPNYCSGCPHNVVNPAPAGQVAWGSPGCHSFASIIEQPERHIVSMTQLGGEGLPVDRARSRTPTGRTWSRTSATARSSTRSYLNIRFCVAAGANITFKILYNGYVANTGAQEMVGGKPVPELTRLLETGGRAGGSPWS